MANVLAEVILTQHRRLICYKKAAEPECYACRKESNGLLLCICFSAQCINLCLWIRYQQVSLPFARNTVWHVHTALPTGGAVWCNWGQRLAVIDASTKYNSGPDIPIPLNMLRSLRMYGSVISSSADVPLILHMCRCIFWRLGSSCSTCFANWSHEKCCSWFRRTSMSFFPTISSAMVILVMDGGNGVSLSTLKRCWRTLATVLVLGMMQRWCSTAHLRMRGR